MLSKNNNGTAHITPNGSHLVTGAGYQMQPSLFDIQYTIDRRNESWYSVKSCKRQLEQVKDCLRNGGKTSRQIAQVTGIERTSVTRVLSQNKKLFDDTLELIDSTTGKRVTVYRLKEEV